MKENSKDISYCALYCPDCQIYKGDMSIKSKELRIALENANFRCWAKPLSKMVDEVKDFKYYNKFEKVLKLLEESMVCEKFCKDGGGTSTCKIRKCCENKKLNGCWECEKYENCETLNWLQPLNKDGNIKHCKIINEKGIKEFIKGKKYC